MSTMLFVVAVMVTLLSLATMLPIRDASRLGIVPFITTRWFRPAIVAVSAEEFFHTFKVLVIHITRIIYRGALPQSVRYNPETCCPGHRAIPTITRGKMYHRQADGPLAGAGRYELIVLVFKTIVLGKGYIISRDEFFKQFEERLGYKPIVELNQKSLINSLHSGAEERSPLDTPWNQLTEKEQLWDMYSDLYKDLNGIRPRWMVWEDYTLEHLKRLFEFDAKRLEAQEDSQHRIHEIERRQAEIRAAEERDEYRNSHADEDVFWLEVEKRELEDKMENEAWEQFDNRDPKQERYEDLRWQWDNGIWLSDAEWAEMLILQKTYMDLSDPEDVEMLESARRERLAEGYEPAARFRATQGISRNRIPKNVRRYRAGDPVAVYDNEATKQAENLDWAEYRIEVESFKIRQALYPWKKEEEPRFPNTKPVYTYPRVRKGQRTWKRERRNQYQAVTYSSNAVHEALPVYEASCGSFEDELFELALIGAALN